MSAKDQCADWHAFGIFPSGVDFLGTFLSDPGNLPPGPERELIKKVWEGRPAAARSARQMRIVSLIDEEDVIERILRHLGLGQERVRVHCGTDSPLRRPW